MSKLSVDAQVTIDFNQLKGIINNAETGKITEAQANQAFQTQYDAMSAKGDSQQVLSKLINTVSGDNSSLKAFPKLDIATSSSNDVVTFTPKGQANTLDAPTAAFDVINGTLTFSTANEIQAHQATDAHTANTYVKPIIDSVSAFANGSQSAQTTEAQVKQELVTANAAGYNVSDPKIRNVVQGLASLDNLQVNFDSDQKGAIEISHGGPGNDSQIVSINSDASTVVAQNNSDENTKIMLKDIGKGAFLGTAVAGSITWCWDPVLIPLGTVIGGLYGIEQGFGDIQKHSSEGESEEH
jgi:hypothetical protein